MKVFKFFAVFFVFISLGFSQSEKEEQIKLLFEDISLEAQVYGMFDGLSELIIASFEVEDIPVELANEMMDYLVQPESVKLFIEMSIPVYDKYFTYDEIIELRVFFNSQAGKKFVSMTPLLSQELEKVGEEWAIFVMIKYFSDYFEE